MAISSSWHRGLASDSENEERAGQPGSSSMSPPPTLPREHSIDNNDNESRTSGSVPLAASSPPTDSDGDGEAHPQLHGGDKGQADTATGTAYLREVLQNVDSVRCGQHPALKRHFHRLELPLPLPAYLCFRRFLEDGPGALGQIEADLDLDLDLDLELLWRWSTDHLVWDYDAKLALLMIRTNTALHQLTSYEVEILLKDRFRAALERMGRRATVKTLPNIGQVFREPQDRPAPPYQQPHLSSLPRRMRSTKGEVRQQRDRAANIGACVGRVAEEPVVATKIDTVSGESSPDIGKENVRSPDIGLLYCPNDGPEDYYPSVVVEVGYSHPVHDSVAKRFIRYSNGTVRFVMAFNVEYNAAHRGRKITIDAYRLAMTDDEWYPEKFLEGYDVRANAEALASDENDPVEVDIGLRLSHLHELLLPGEGQDDVPIKLPLRRLASIVDTALSRQNLHDSVSSRSAPAPTPQVLRGKRARTETPPAGGDDEAALLRDPDAGYVVPQASFPKRRRTNKTTG